MSRTHEDVTIVTWMLVTLFNFFWHPPKLSAAGRVNLTWSSSIKSTYPHSPSSLWAKTSHVSPPLPFHSSDSLGLWESSYQVGTATASTTINNKFKTDACFRYALSYLATVHLSHAYGLTTEIWFNSPEEFSTDWFGLLSFDEHPQNQLALKPLSLQAS